MGTNSAGGSAPGRGEDKQEIETAACLGLRWRSLLESLITLAEHHPRLLTPNPDMPGRSEPRCIVQRACPDTDYSIPGWAGNP